MPPTEFLFDWAIKLRKPKSVSVTKMRVMFLRTRLFCRKLGKSGRYCRIVFLISCKATQTLEISSCVQTSNKFSISLNVATMRRCASQKESLILSLILSGSKSGASQGKTKFGRVWVLMFRSLCVWVTAVCTAAPEDDFALTSKKYS